MSAKSKSASRALIATLLFGAFIGAVRAQEQFTPAGIPGTSLPDPQRQAQESALAERRQTMIDECEQNHGTEIDCVRETETELRAEGLQRGGLVIHLRPAH